MSVSLTKSITTAARSYKEDQKAKKEAMPKAQVAQPKSSSKAAFKRKAAEEASNDMDKFKTKRLKEAATFNSKKERPGKELWRSWQKEGRRKSERPRVGDFF